METENSLVVWWVCIFVNVVGVCLGRIVCVTEEETREEILSEAEVRGVIHGCVRLLCWGPATSSL